MAKKVSTRRAWTTEHVRTLKTLARKKTRAASIAKTLKRTEGATRQKAFSLGLSLELARVTSRRSVSATLPTSPATHVRGAFLYPISAYIRATPLPRCISINAVRAECFCGTVAAQERFDMISDKARRWAEVVFKKEERDRDGQAAMTEYEVQARATREKTAGLKAFRLAKQAQ